MTSATRGSLKIEKPKKPPVNMTVLVALMDPVSVLEVYDAFISFGWQRAPDLNEPPDLAEVQQRFDGYHVVHRERMQRTYAVLERFYWAHEKASAMIPPKIKPGFGVLRVV